MSIITTGVPTAASGILNPAQVAPPPRVDSNTAVQNAINHAPVVSSAAVISLSATGKKRAASTGEDRRTDAAWEKEEVKEKQEKDKQNGEKTAADGSSSSAINVTA